MVSQAHDDELVAAIEKTSESAKVPLNSVTKQNCGCFAAIFWPNATRHP